MEYTLHRLLRLFSCLEPVEVVRPLFCKFYEFEDETPITSATQGMLDRANIRLGGVQTKAMRRCELILDLATRHKIPQTSRVCYMINVVVQAHMTIVFDETLEDVSDVYRKTRAPEQLNFGSLWTVQSIKRLHETTERLWCPFFGQHNCWGKRWNHSDAEHKIMSKGMPNPTSIRYIGNQLFQELQEQRNTNMVKCALHCAVLGSYEHVATPTPLSAFVWVYSHTGDADTWNEVVIKKLNSREIYALLCEFIICMTGEHSALLLALSHMPSWPAYTRSCVETMESHVRKRLWKLFDGEKAACSAIGRSYYNKHRIGQMDTQALSMVRCNLPVLGTILGVKTKIPAGVITTLGGASNVSELFMDALNSLPIQSICTQILFKWGVSISSWNEFCKFARNCDLRHNKRMTRALGRLSKREKAVLHVIVFALMERLRFGIVPRAQYKRLTHADKVIVCIRCMSIRSRSRGLGKTNNMGVLLDMSQSHCIRCSSCLDDAALRVVELKNCSAILSPSPCGKTNHAISQCTGCGMATLSTALVYFDNNAVCKNCYALRITPKSTTPVCFVGCLIRIKNHMRPTTFLALDSSRVCKRYHACEKHKRFIPKQGVLPIETILGITGHAQS